MVPARFCIALVVALAVGADAALPAFTIGTWEMVNPDANSDWAETYTQNADGTFTGYGSWTDAGQAYAYTYYGASTVQDCNKNTDGTMSMVEAFWLASSGHDPTTPGMMRMSCVYVTWSGSDASRTSTGRFRSAEVPIGTPLGECPLLPPHLVADIPWMEVYGEVTRDPGGERKYKCVADCEPQPWDSCDAASTEDGGSSGGGADAAATGLIIGVVVGVAALAAIAFGAYVHMRSKGGILGSRRGCACGGRALVRASSRGRAIILTPTRAEIAEPKSSQSYERARARAGTVGERLPPAGAPGAQDLASLILCTQAVASRCPWCCPIV